MTVIDLTEINRRIDEYQDKSDRYYNESDYEVGNYFRGLHEGLREAIGLLVPVQDDYLDHPPLD